jgi:hypothetical protein
MKTLLLALSIATTLGGCAVVPAYGPPGVYAPTVVVPFGGYYGYRGGHGHRGYR